ncbi:LysR family transcriptional regulator [Dermacoccaceae bacterium W4C1]
MEIHQLRYFVAVADAGSFTAAAAAEHVSQSGVSTQIAKLERELGSDLLVRGRTVELTATGASVLPLARAVLEQVDQIGAAAAQIEQVVRGRVRLGMIAGCTIGPFLDAVATFQKSHPGVDLTLHEADSPELQESVADVRLDLALVSLGAPSRPGLRVRMISDEPLMVVLPRGHRWRRARVHLADLSQERVLGLPLGTGIRTALARSCDLVGIPDPTRMQASSPETLIELTRRGTGVSVMTASMVDDADLILRPLQDAQVTAGLALVSPTRANPAAHLLLERLEEALLG